MRYELKGRVPAPLLTSVNYVIQLHQHVNPLGILVRMFTSN